TNISTNEISFYLCIISVWGGQENAILCCPGNYISFWCCCSTYNGPLCSLRNLNIHPVPNPRCCCKVGPEVIPNNFVIKRIYTGLLFVPEDCYSNRSVTGN